MSRELAEERQRKIDEMIQKLASTDPAERKEAALYLGEAAAGDAVDSLVDLYENDGDRNVRKAAAYALGMFKAVEKEISKGDKSKERVVKLLEQVENRGRLGRRANRGSLYSTVWILLILFALLLGLIYFWQDTDRRGSVLLRVGAITVTPDRRREQTFLISRQLELVRADLNTLTTQFQAVEQGGVADCTAYFNNPAPLPPDVFLTTPELASVSTSLNGVLVDLLGSKSRFDSACSNPNAAFGAADVAPFMPTLSSALERITAIEAEFAPFAPIVPTITPIPTATIDPRITPSPTAAVANPLSHLNALYELADSMNRPNSSTLVLKGYWEDVARTGDTLGCTARVIDTPDNYTLPAIDAEASPQLAHAVELINTALDAIREGWVTFRFSCNSQTLPANAAAQLQMIANAQSTFRSAIPVLDAVRDSGGSQ